MIESEKLNLIKVFFLSWHDINHSFFFFFFENGSRGDLLGHMSQLSVNAQLSLDLEKLYDILTKSYRRM